MDQARTVAADVRVMGEKPNPAISALVPVLPEPSEPDAETAKKALIEIEPAPEKQKPAPAAIRRQPALAGPVSRMTIKSRNGSLFKAASLVVYGESAVLLPGGGVIKLDDIDSIDAPAGALRLNQADVWTGSLHRQGSGFLTAEKAFIPLQALREIRIRD